MQGDIEVGVNLAGIFLSDLRRLVSAEPDKVWHGTIDGGDTAVAAQADDRSLSLTINGETGILQVLCTAFLHPEAPDPELAKLLAEEQEIERQARQSTVECADRFDLVLALDEPDIVVVIDEAGERTVYA